MRVIVLVAALLLAAAIPVFAQETDEAKVPDEKKEEQKKYLYQWTDSKGGVHITDGLGNVPEKYRSRAKRVESGPGAEADVNQAETSRYADDNEREADLKETWQQRMREARQRLSELQQRYTELDQKRTEALGGGMGVYAPAEKKLEAERIAEEMERVQKDIDEARNQIDTEIPDAARKAGVPPGWLRE